MSIMILNESTISILMPWSSLVLEVTKLLKTQVVLESLILRFIFIKLVFNGCLTLWPFILHGQESRHNRALLSLWLVHWLTILVVRYARAFPKMKSPRRPLEPV